MEIKVLPIFKWMLIAGTFSLPVFCCAAQGVKRNSDTSAKAADRTQEREAKIASAKQKKIVYQKVETKNYTIEVPENWEVGEETSFGQREIHPGKEMKENKEIKEAKETRNAKEIVVDRGASMSSMTGPGLGRQTWKQLYDTSLYFITRGPNKDKMKATQYQIGKSKQNFETCSWTMTDPDGVLLQRHLVLKNTRGNILALSVKIPPTTAKETKERLETIFQHMVDTAVVR